MEHQDKVVARRRMILASYPLDLRRVVRLACECAGLVAWFSGLDMLDLLRAAEHADRSEWEAAGEVAREVRDALLWNSDRSEWEAAGEAAGEVIRIARHAARGTSKKAVWDAGCVARDVASGASAEPGDYVADMIEARAIELLTGES